MIGHASAEDTKLLGGGGSILEMHDLQIVGTALKLSILLSSRYFVSF